MRWNEEPGQPRILRLLVTDRHPLVGAGLAALLVAQRHTVIGPANESVAARAMLAGGGIDIAILDIDMDGQALAAGTLVPVIVIAPGADHPGIASAVDGGCKGLVLRTDSPESLMKCIVAVAAGGQWFDRDAMASVRDRRNAMDGAVALTPRERDVARLVATGQRNRNIGDTLGISEGTVKMHLHNVYAKLGLESRTQLAMDERLRALV